MLPTARCSRLSVIAIFVHLIGPQCSRLVVAMARRAHIWPGGRASSIDGSLLLSPSGQRSSRSPTSKVGLTEAAHRAGEREPILDWSGRYTNKRRRERRATGPRTTVRLTERAHNPAPTKGGLHVAAQTAAKTAHRPKSACRTAGRVRDSWSSGAAPKVYAGITSTQTGRAG